MTAEHPEILHGFDALYAYLKDLGIKKSPATVREWVNKHKCFPRLSSVPGLAFDRDAVHRAFFGNQIPARKTTVFNPSRARKAVGKIGRIRIVDGGRKSA